MVFPSQTPVKAVKFYIQIELHRAKIYLCVILVYPQNILHCIGLLAHKRGKAPAANAFYAFPTRTVHLVTGDVFGYFMQRFLVPADGGGGFDRTPLV